ncbi:MAG: hypothetical protein ABWY81_11020 [Jiangellaceae bacterium]
MFVPYCTRERVAAAADIAAPAWMDGEIDLAIEQGSRAVDKLCRRGDDTRPAFAPWTGTIEQDWPAEDNTSTYRYWLGPHSILTIDSVITGGEDATSAALGYPAQYGAPYDALDLDQAGSDVFTTADGIGQRSLAITGTWCATPIDERSAVAWTLSGSINSSAPTADLLAPLGVGSLIRIGSERIVVTDRTWTATADTATLAANMNDMTLAVASGAAYLRGDVLLVGAERVKVRDIAGNTLVVQRAADGSALAAHTTTGVYVQRTCGVARGALGTTAAAHTAGDPIYVYRFPAVVEKLAVAYALDQLAQETANYARTVGSGDGERNATLTGLKAAEERVLSAYGRALYGAA